MIANVAPGRDHFFNSDATMRFASKSRQIMNTPVVNERIGMWRLSCWCRDGLSTALNFYRGARAREEAARERHQLGESYQEVVPSSLYIPYDSDGVLWISWQWN